ncbi:sulfatase [Verrucomicrobia bacterium S94]|nr:sulfatase [Verrucomicrobia bacterium S94]
MMKKTLLLSLLALSSQTFSGANPPRPQPNIVLFFVDDMGWADLGYRQPEVFETPNIDRLAEQSVDFQQAYIACPTCSPSRSTLVTGKHPARLEIVRHIPTGSRKHPEFDKYGRTEQEYSFWETDPAHFPVRNWLPKEHITYAEALQELGYYNLFVGKWHLGHEPYHPVHQGWDKQIGTSNWGHPNSGYNAPFFKNSDVYADVKEGYLTDKLTEDTIQWLENYDQKKPFMISLWYYAVHSPFDGRPDYVKHFEAKGIEGKYAHYAAMVKSVDDSIGRIRKVLKDKGVDDNTIIIFLSDQGGAFDNPPFHGGKKLDTLYEGGARVPFLFYWPGVTKAGKNQSIVQSTDLFPTLIEIAGGNPDKFDDLDGVSLKETIEKNSTLNRGEPIFGFRAYEDLYASVREGDWKLLAYRSGTLKLYNIAQDTGETNDLASSLPEKVKELKAKLIDWEKEMNVEKYSGVQ